MQALSLELKGAPGSLVPMKCDVTKDGEVQDMFKQVIDKHGPVYVCVNNAGFTHKHSLLGNLECTMLLY